ncbi:hypothetical protein AB0E01_23155 [Nocardia vinacea]|uniref:hypothetical protein n=1 Tax=Nocardia vinacea TaxID=96468 RepID=UPI0033E1D4DA
MTMPHGSPPAGAFVVGSRYGQDVTDSSARAIMSGGVVTSFSKAQDSMHSEYNAKIEDHSERLASLEGIEPTSILSPIWHGTADADIVSFPRYSLMQTKNTSDNTQDYLAAYYVPANQVIDIVYVRADREIEANSVKILTAAPGTFDPNDLTGFYVGLYGYNASGGTLDLLWASSDVKTQISTAATEYRFTLGSAVSVKPGHLLAVAILQNTNGSTRNLTMHPQPGVRQATNDFPPGPCAYLTGRTSLPNSIDTSDLSYNNQIIPWVAVST